MAFPEKLCLSRTSISYYEQGKNVTTDELLK